MHNGEFCKYAVIIPVIIVIPKLLSTALEEKSLKPMYIDTLFQEITVF